MSGPNTKTRTTRKQRRSEVNSKIDHFVIDITTGDSPVRDLPLSVALFAVISFKLVHHSRSQVLDLETTTDEHIFKVVQVKMPLMTFHNCHVFN